MRRRKSKHYYFDRESVDVIADDLNDFSIVESTDEMLDNFDLIKILIYSALTSRDENRVHLTTMMALSVHCGNDIAKGLSGEINDIMQLDTYLDLIDDIRDIIGTYDKRDIKVDIIAGKLVVILR